MADSSLPESSPAAAASEVEGRSREHWVVLGLAGATLLGLVVLGVALAPDERGFGTHEKLGLQPCLPMELWNIPCPGCGVTTSVSLAMHGDLWGSFVNQPFGFLVAVFFAGFVGWAVVGHFLGRDLWRDVNALRYGRWLSGLAVFVALAWVYKLALVRGWFVG